jgi:CIC family chloride channel protein
MTSVFMIVEVSGNYSIILPVMISNTIAYLVSRRFQEQPLFDLLSRQDGIELPSMEEERESQIRCVEDAMRSADAVLVDRAESAPAALDRMAASGSDVVLVPLDAGVWGTVTRAEAEASNGRPLGDIAAAIPRPYLHPDQSIEAALRALAGRRMVPVIHRADPRRLEGALSLDDLLRATE